MKKTFLFRLFAITFFCLASLAIQSETSSCGSTGRIISKDGIRLTILKEATSNQHYKNDVFFIRI